jgi:hypothetical protein
MIDDIEGVYRTETSLEKASTTKKRLMHTIKKYVIHLNAIYKI